MEGVCMSGWRRGRGLWTGIVALALLSGCGVTGPDLTQGITVFEHNTYRGSHRTYVDDHNLLGLGDWSSGISSIRVASGWQAIVYSDRDFAGDSLIVTIDIPDLEAIGRGGGLPGPCFLTNWGDCISSIRVRHSP